MRSLYDSVLFQASVEPQRASTVDGSTVNGTAIDTAGYNTAVLRARIAAPAGSPTGSTTTVYLQESDSSTANFVPALDNTGAQIGGTSVVTTAVADAIVARIEGLGQNRKRYLRAVVKNNILGGSSTSITYFAEIVLGRGYNKHAVSTVSNT